MGVVYATIKERITTVECDIELVCNNATDVIEISFDDEWEGKSGYIARFAWANKYIDVPFAGNRVQVPEIINTTYVFFGVYADNIASTPVKVNCKKSILCLGDNVHQPPANPFYDEFVERLGNVEDAIGNFDDYARNYFNLPRLMLNGNIDGMSKNNEKILSFTYYDAGTNVENLSGYAKVKWQGSSSLAYTKKTIPSSYF